MAQTCATRTSLVQRNIQFRRKLVGIERAGGEKSLADFDCGHFSAALVYAQDKILGVGFLVDVHFLKGDAAIFEELLGAAAVHAPTRPI